MAKCYCVSYSCGGKEVHPRTQQNHLREDRRNASVQAYEASRRALDDQEEEITEFISTLTLSNNVSESNSESGGRLWSRSSPPISVAKEGPETTNGRKYLDSTKTDSCLRLLKVLESEFQSISSSLSRIPSIGIPSSRSSVFPLRPDLTSAYNVQDQLIGITNKSPIVRELKESLVVRLSTFITTLKEAQDIWIKTANKISRERQDHDETTYVTGEVYLLEHFSSILTNRENRPSLFGNPRSC